MSFAAPTRERSKPAVPLAGMVDVLFLLLIFFMTASAFREQEQQIDVSLPQAESARTDSGAFRGPVTITITPDGVIYMGESQHTVATLRAALKEIHAEYPEQAIVVRGDEESRLGTTIQVVDAAYAIGLKNVHLAARQPGGG